MAKQGFLKMELVTTEDNKASKFLEEERKKLIEKCKHEMDALLEKYKCAIEAQMLLTMHGAVPLIRVVYVGEKENGKAL